MHTHAPPPRENPLAHPAPPSTLPANGADLFQLDGHTYSPSLQVSGWVEVDTCQRRHQSPPLRWVSDIVQTFGIPEGCLRWGSEPHHQETRGFLDMACGLRGSSTLTPSPKGRERGVNFQEVATRQNGPGGSLAPTPLHGPQPYLKTPPRGPNLPTQLITEVVGTPYRGTLAL
ncbi:hypothetical protein GWK47_054227 [Chionoecetes opilio]|uniref:Uncharacterized protein n=1 Tax=Chionoecetes opilio TaxID=41210 RepID=A0A8J4Y0E1_CHIOP|nr:hypothetical protein GWK47_054227 [Chionoecetes opilio]